MPDAIATVFFEATDADDAANIVQGWTITTDGRIEVSIAETTQVPVEEHVTVGMADIVADSGEPPVLRRPSGDDG